MSTVNRSGTSTLTTPLQSLLQANAIEPGSVASYQLCKAIYEYHPLGKKMVDAPIAMAQSQMREINVQDGPEEIVREAFNRQWEADGANRHIASVARIARMYGVGACAVVADGMNPSEPMDFSKLWKETISYNCLDPLNVSGSIVLNQDPNDPTFLKVRDIAVAGKIYHRSRAIVMMNEDPIYISFTASAFGYAGRSVYQRALYPLKSFVQTMVTDDMVSRKAGLLIAKMKAAGSIVDRMMQAAAGIKRTLLRDAETDNVLSIDTEEDIQSLDLTNIPGAMESARKHNIENAATAADMPAKILLQETFAEGFGEGTEDAKYVARYVEGFRRDLMPLYVYFDKIIQHRAWNPDFYKTVQAQFPEYEKIPYDAAFQQWRNSFTAVWPSLLIEPESEMVQVDEVRFRAVVSMLEVLLPKLDPLNQAALIQWAADNFNERKLLFSSPIELDFDGLAQHIAMQSAKAQMMGGEPGGDEVPKPPRPMADSYSDSVRSLIEEAQFAVARRKDRAAKRREYDLLRHNLDAVS
jgi:hypothetical protein